MPPSAFGIPTTPSKLTGTKYQPFASSCTTSAPTMPNGKHHPSTTEPGYSLSIGDLADFAGVGHPIIRVYFHCNAAAEKRVSLGRYPTNTSDEPTRFTDPPPPPAPTSRAMRHAPTEISDPATRVLRPASDITITSETQPGRGQPFRRVARPSENRWETHHYREALKKRSLHEVEINHRCVCDPDATFPDDAIRGERDTRTKDDRNVYRDTVRLCNTHPDPAAAANADDPRSPRLATPQYSNSLPPPTVPCAYGSHCYDPRPQSPPPHCVPNHPTTDPRPWARNSPPPPKPLTASRDWSRIGQKRSSDSNHRSLPTPLPKPQSTERMSVAA